MTVRFPVAGIVVPTTAGMAVWMGVGRFVYTPILPLIAARAGLSPQWGHLEFEYMRRLGHVVDLAGPPDAPLRALHLGGTQ